VTALAMLCEVMTDIKELLCQSTSSPEVMPSSTGTIRQKTVEGDTRANPSISCGANANVMF
jgi:hypothetical protein